MNRRRDTIGRGQKSGRAGSWYGKSSERLAKAVSGAVRTALARRACTTVGESRRNPPRDSGRPKRPEHGVGRAAFHAAASGLRQRSHPNALGRLPGVPPSEVPGRVAHGRKKVRSGVLLADVRHRSPLKWAGSRTGQPALIEVEGQAPVPSAAEASRPQVHPRRNPPSSCTQSPASRVAYPQRIGASPFDDNHRETDGRPSGGMVPDANETERRPPVGSGPFASSLSFAKRLNKARRGSFFPMNGCSAESRQTCARLPNPLSRRTSPRSPSAEAGTATASASAMVARSPYTASRPARAFMTPRGRAAWSSG